MGLLASHTRSRGWCDHPQTIWGWPQPEDHPGVVAATPDPLVGGRPLTGFLIFFFNNLNFLTLIFFKKKKEKKKENNVRCF
jgi:hypothetical protein